MVQHKIKIGLIQTGVSEDLQYNLKKTLSLAEEAIDKGAKIICLQELFRLPYFPQYENADAEIYAETLSGESAQAFSELAKKHHVVIIVPVFEKTDEGKFYNSAIVIDTDGTVMPAYHKVHIPYDPLFYEKNYFYPGDSYRVYDTTFGKLGVLICYDQWFSEAARATALMGAEIIFYPTAIGRISGLDDPTEGDWKSAWTTVQQGHAISNSVFVAAVNRTGTEGDIEFWGGSFVCDPFGNIIAEAGETEEILVAETDLSLNRDIREGWGFMRNRRPETYGILTKNVDVTHLSEGYICPPKSRPNTPKKEGFFMPAEWEHHDAVWLSWPDCGETFFDLLAVEQSYTEIISEISVSENVRLLVRNESTRERVLELLIKSGADLKKVSFFIYDYADLWFRDYGPVFVVNREKRQVASVDWIFNAWGDKYEELKEDTGIPSFISKIQGMRSFGPGIVLEGGSIDVNGSGTLLTTKQCLLNKNRNPHLSKEEIEEYLSEYLGAENAIWLDFGIEGDDTDGHIDDIARFVNKNTVICALEEDKAGDNYDILRKNYDILKNSKDENNNPLNVVTVPMPGRIDPEMPLPASYTNFYIGNDVVLVPIFGTENDGRALSIIQKAFPNRRIKGINCRAMVYGLGTIHCISQQQPSP
ncbi:MAG: agmatine deiminase family protein [Methanomicrobiaceae archaeon]|nr:agmatine deiminase family protein [Methanomicrobiaceae archaeon]